MTTLFERRSYDRPVQLRAAREGSNGPGILTGYGAVFNSESRDLGGFIEVIDPGAFPTVEAEGRTLVDVETNGRVIARDNHDSNGLLGTTSAGTLRLYRDNIGIFYEVDLPDTQRGHDVAVLAERGDYAHSSFAFRTLPGGDRWRENDAGLLVRTVTRAVLTDVAPVADPAYWAATTELARSIDLAAVRESLNDQTAEPGDWEKAFATRAAARATNRKKESR